MLFIFAIVFFDGKKFLCCSEYEPCLFANVYNFQSLGLLYTIARLSDYWRNNEELYNGETNEAGEAGNMLEEEKDTEYKEETADTPDMPSEYAAEEATDEGEDIDEEDESNRTPRAEYAIGDVTDNKAPEETNADTTHSLDDLLNVIVPYEAPSADGKHAEQ